MAGKRDSRRHSTASFNKNVEVAEKKLSNVRSFIILRSGEGLPSFNKENSANVSGEKKSTIKLSGIYRRKKTFSHISSS